MSHIFAFATAVEGSCLLDEESGGSVCIVVIVGGAVLGAEEEDGVSTLGCWEKEEVEVWRERVGGSSGNDIAIVAVIAVVVAGLLGSCSSNAGSRKAIVFYSTA